MREINDLMASAISAEPMDNEEAQNVQDEVVELIQNKDAFASKNLTVDSIEQEAMTSTSVWNENIVRVEIEDGVMGGEVEVISSKDEDEYFIGMTMSLGMGFGMQEDPQTTYIHADSDDLSEFMDYSMPDDIRTHEFYIQMVENSEVSVDGSTVFFRNRTDNDELTWIDSDTFKEDVVTEGIDFIVTYDLEESQLQNQLLTVRNVDDMNTHVVGEFIYDAEFKFNIPNVGDDNVVQMSEAMGGGMGGGSPFGGGVEDVLGGGVDDLLGDDTDLF